jgi:hypothetical protein
MLASPGVAWLRAPQSSDSLVVGLWDEHTFLIIEDEQVVGIDAASGEQRWSITPEHRPEAAAIDANNPILYTADQLGRVEAFRLPDSAANNESTGSITELESLWQADLEAVGTPQLIPLPGNGIVISVWDNVIGLSSEGKLLWQIEAFGRPFNWLSTGDLLLLSTVGSEEPLWTFDESGPEPWPGLGSGALAFQAGGAFLFNDRGLFRLNLGDRSSVLLSDWPKDALRASDVIGLEDGGALVTHLSRADRRLIYFDAGGSIIWQRSLPDDIAGTPTLQSVAGKPYLIVFGATSNTGTVSVYAIDVEHASLAHIFGGGTRTPRSSLNSAYQSDDGKLILNIGGGHLVSLDPMEATQGTTTAASINPLPQ